MPRNRLGLAALSASRYRFDPVAELQIGAADDPRRRPARAIGAAGAGGGQTLHELDLADRA
jgi:hypothetical protein